MAFWWGEGEKDRGSLVEIFEESEPVAVLNVLQF